MPNVEFPIPGEPILAEWGADVVTRVAQTFPTVIERDAFWPVPEEGQLAYIESIGELEVFDGAAWQPLSVLYLSTAGGTITGALAVTGDLFAAGGIVIPDSTAYLENRAAPGEWAAPVRWQLDDGRTARVQLNINGELVASHSPDGEAGWQNHLVIIGGGSAAAARLVIDSSNADPQVTTRGRFIVQDDAGNPRLFVDPQAVAGNPRAIIGQLSLGQPDTQFELRLGDTEGLQFRTNNSTGSSILEYLRISKAGTTARVSYRGSASTATAVAAASWFTSNEITTGSRSIGQMALAQSANTEPAPAVLDELTDPTVAALAAVPVRRGEFSAGELVAGDPRIGVAHPMILADELEALAPEMVDHLPRFDDDGVPLSDDLAINQPIYAAALLAYIHQLEARIAALESP